MSFRAALTGFALALFAALPAQADDGKIYPAEAAIPNSRVIRFTSAIDKEPYTIQVSIPLWPAPKGGYPVIYVLDGDLYFPEVAMASDLMFDKGAVVVGVGYGALNDKAVTARYAGGKPGRPMNGDASTDAITVLRNHDFKWPARPEHRAPVFFETMSTNNVDSGNLDAFLQVIEKEIKPKVEAIAPIDRGNQALFGHSLGGLAVVRALFTEPAAYHSFIAVSPSLWYDGGAVLNDEMRFVDGVTKGLFAPRVLIAVGSRESLTNAFPKEFMDKLTQAQRAEFAPYQKMRNTWPAMIPGARDLAARLKALHGKPGYKVEYQLIADQDHGGAPYVAIIRALPFAFVEK
jgi:predicted alpha/beta superfamily hydrolase